MPKSDPAADALSRLKACAADPKSESSLAEISKALSGKINLAAAKAAAIVGEAKLEQFIPPMIAAFDRFMQKPATTDKGCAAKTAIAKALYEMEAPAQELFLVGVRHVQHEPVWGGQSDTAADLRGYSALGLVRTNYRDTMTELGDLLMDPVPAARLMAARAIGYSGNPAGAPLLRMKILAGDKSYDVIGEALASLMKLTPRAGVTFAARLLDAPEDDLREAAALAIGESRQPAAFELLSARFAKEMLADQRKTLLLAIAMTRLPVAIDFVLRAVAEEDRITAVDAIDAMRMYRSDDAVRGKLSAIVVGRNDLAAAFQTAFG